MLTLRRAVLTRAQGVSDRPAGIKGVSVVSSVPSKARHRARHEAVEMPSKGFWSREIRRAHGRWAFLPCATRNFQVGGPSLQASYQIERLSGLSQLPGAYACGYLYQQYCTCVPTRYLCGAAWRYGPRRLKVATSLFGCLDDSFQRSFPVSRCACPSKRGVHFSDASMAVHTPSVVPGAGDGRRGGRPIRVCPVAGRASRPSGCLPGTFHTCILRVYLGIHLPTYLGTNLPTYLPNLYR